MEALGNGKNEHQIDRTNKILSVSGWILILLGPSLALPRTITDLTYGDATYELAILLAISTLPIFGGIRCLKTRKSSTLSAEQKLSRLGRMVSGFHCCCYGIVGILLAILGVPVLAVVFSVLALLLLVSTVAFIKKDLGKATRFLITAGILSFPLGLPAMVWGLVIRSAMKLGKTGTGVPA